jgi:hypothetical protein
VRILRLFDRSTEKADLYPDCAILVNLTQSETYAARVKEDNGILFLTSETLLFHILPLFIVTIVGKDSLGDV